MRWILLSTLLVAGCGDALVEDAQKAVQRSVKDPTSVLFSNVRKCARPKMVMGDYNAKNSFGAYTGNETFVYVNGVAYLQPEHRLEVDNQAPYRFFIQLIDACGNAKGQEITSYADYMKAFEKGTVGRDDLFNGAIPVPE